MYVRGHHLLSTLAPCVFNPGVLRKGVLVDASAPITKEVVSCIALVH